MKQKTLNDKIIWTISGQLREYTNFESWIPKGRALLALHDSWTGKYKYFYSIESLLNWWTELFE